MSMDPELYQEVILQHSRKPRHYGKIDDATHEADGFNALCGDEIHVQLRSQDGRIEKVHFTGHACAICTASASIMTCETTGLEPDAIRDLSARFRTLAKDGIAQDIPTRLEVLAGVYRFPARVKCAVLPWETLLRALEQPLKAEAETPDGV